MYHKRYELQWRFNVFFSFCILSRAWSGVSLRTVNIPQHLAHHLLAATHVRTRKDVRHRRLQWVALDLRSGGSAERCGCCSGAPFIVDWPETASFLNESERHILLRRLQDDGQESRMDHLDKKAQRRAFSDWKIYLGSVIVFQ